MLTVCEIFAGAKQAKALWISFNKAWACLAPTNILHTHVLYCYFFQTVWSEDHAFSKVNFFFKLDGIQQNKIVQENFTNENKTVRDARIFVGNSQLLIPGIKTA
jgi:hypothetical protein